MTATVEQLRSALAQLPIPERAAIAHFLLHTLDEGADLDAEAAWDAELARRFEEIQSGVAVGEPADSVFARLREKHS